MRRASQQSTLAIIFGAFVSDNQACRESVSDKFRRIR